MTVGLLSPYAGGQIAGQILITPELFGAVGDGVTDDSVALQKWLNDVPNSLYAGSKTYFHNTTLIINNNTRIQGAVNNTSATSGTVFLYGGTSDQFQVNNPINTPTPANISISDVCFKAQTRTTGKANLSSLASSGIRTYRCTFGGADYGIIHDQDELSVDEDDTFNLPVGGTAGIWFVNGPDHTPGANLFLTNVNHVNRCEFSSNGTATGIIDDGGSNHIITNNNFNDFATGIRINGSLGEQISGNEFDNCTTAISTTITRYNGQTGSISSGLNISTNTIGGTGGIVFTGSSVAGFTYTNNVFNISGSPDNITSVDAFGANPYFSSGNVQNGLGGQPTNNFDLLGSFMPTWLSTGTQPVLGNGTIYGNYFRNGSQVTVNIELTLGSTSTVGTGNYSFGNLPFPSDGNVNTHYTGSGVVNQSSSGNYYVINSSMITGGSSIFAQSNGVSAQVGAASPIAFASGDKIRMSLTYATFIWK